MKLNKISIMLLEDIIILNIFVLPIKKILQFKSPEFISSHDKFTETIKLIKENNFTYTYESLEIISSFYKELRLLYYNFFNINHNDYLNQNILLIHYVNVAKFTYTVGLFLRYTNKKYLTPLIYFLNDQCLTSINIEMDNYDEFCSKYNLPFKEKLKIDFSITNYDIDIIKKDLIKYFNSELNKLTTDITIILDNKDIDLFDLEKNLKEFDKLIYDETFKTSLNKLTRYNELIKIQEQFRKIILILKNKKHIKLLNFALDNLNIQNCDMFDLLYIIFKFLELRYIIIKNQKLKVFISSIDDFVDWIQIEFMQVISKTTVQVY